MQHAVKSVSIRRLGMATLFLAVLPFLVHAQPLPNPTPKAENGVNQKAVAPNSAVEVLRDTSLLPAPVARMRSAILSSAASGDIANLRIPMDMNEIPPMLTAEKVTDPVAFWKKISGDGEGREILAITIELLRTGYVKKTLAAGQEMYIWPYFAELPLDKLTPAQEVELLTLVSPARLKEMRAKGKYDHYRIGIGQDGVWHFFRNGAQ
jgi:hypothetical protein